MDTLKDGMDRKMVRDLSKLESLSPAEAKFIRFLNRDIELDRWKPLTEKQSRWLEYIHEQRHIKHLAPKTGTSNRAHNRTSSLPPATKSPEFIPTPYANVRESPHWRPLPLLNPRS